jgi:glycosyltransferase involved in cell wall biosynthesis
MKISIVTISFNQKKYLKQCIESILGQTECALEYIVVDPGSTDGSRELIESYGNAITKIFEPDQGPVDGLTKGFEHATGDIFGFVNSDDYLLPHALMHVTNYFNEHKAEKFVTGRGFSESATGHRSAIKVRQLTQKNMLHRAAVLFQQATFFQADLYRQVGGFDADNLTCWDYELFLKFLISGARHQVINHELAVFRLHPESISGSGRLTTLYLSELDRLFIKYTGRTRGLADRLHTGVLRLQRELSAF